jgi:osmotically-inducible protein OsmY
MGGDSGEIQTSIQTALQKDATLANDNIIVNVTDRQVELVGTVASAEEKDKAKRIAKANAGGRNVVDHLKVQSTSQGGRPY